MDPTLPPVQKMATKAHEAFSLAVSFLNTTSDPQLLPLQDATSKTIGAYFRVHLPYIDQILSTVVRLWDFYAPQVLEILVGVVPPLFVSIPLLLLSVPILSYIIYQLYFHPLAKYPGPLWAKFSGSRRAYHALRGTLHYDMWECHQKYDIYGHNKNMQKSLPYLAMVHNTPSTFTLRNKKEHAWKKRILSQKISDSAIRSYEPEVLKIVDRFCDVMSPKASEKTHPNLGDNLFFDLMTTTVFGENFDLLRSQWYRHIPEALTRSNKRISVICQWPLIVWRRLDKALFKDSVQGRKEFLRFVHNLVTDRMTAGAKNDVFSGLLDASDPTTGNSLSRDEIVAESILMIVAGSDTSGTLLASMFFYMARNPEKKARLVKEVRTCFATREEVRLGAKLNSCRYLQACISECLRMAPPVASAPFREVAVGGATVDGHFLPEGANVGTGIYSIQHNELYFPRPFEFLPERWLQDENPCGVNVSEALVPFSIGPRACLGKGIAVAEGTLATAYICWMLDFEVVESKKDIGGGTKNGRHGRHRLDEYQLYDHITSARDGPWITFRRNSEL
ncbi:cytochrome P450 [Rhexocercosporidium sp. MPI-PUGE-AT-0058]|nr:cytochrome P450 [Rhexocercosporidium sp. MPI-PUGE-AT-0058]